MMSIMKVQYSRYLIIFLLLSCIVATIFNSKMHLSTKSSYHQVFSEAVTIAIAKDLPRYVGYTVIREKIANHATIDNKILHESILLQNQNFDKSKKMIMGVSDIAYTDFIKLSFFLFGYDVSSIVYLYLLIFFVSILVYILEFKNNQTAISILVFFLISYYFILLAVIKSTDLGIIYSPRAISLLGWVSFLHITIFTIFRESKIKIYSVILFLLQSLILAWIYNTRFPMLWMYIFFISLFLYQLFAIFKTRKNNIREKKHLSNYLHKTFPLLITFAAFFMFFIYYNNAKGIDYNNSLGKHVFWHTVLTGVFAYDDAIFFEYTGIKREKHYINFCSIDNEIGIKKVIRNGLCKSLNTKFIIIFTNIMYRESHDQNSTSASLFYLFKNNQDIYQLFNFPKNAPVNISKAFEIFQSNQDLKNQIIMKESINNRDINMSVDFNWIKQEEISIKILSEIIIKNPFKIIKIFILKPIYFIPEFFEYFIGNLFSFFILICVFYWFLKKEVKTTFDKRYSLMLLLLLFFPLIAPFISYFDMTTMLDAMLLFLIILFFILYGFLKNIILSHNK